MSTISPTRKLRSPLAIAAELVAQWPAESDRVMNTIAKMPSMLAAAVAVEVATTLGYDRARPKAASEFRQMLNGYGVGAQL